MIKRIPFALLALAASINPAFAAPRGMSGSVIPQPGGTPATVIIWAGQSNSMTDFTNGFEPATKANLWAGTASFSGTTMTVASTTAGTVQDGQYLFCSTCTTGLTVVSGSGSTWTVSAAQGTQATETVTTGGFTASFTGSASTTPLATKTFSGSSITPSSTSGTLTVSAMTSGVALPGEVLSCSGCAAGTVIASDNFGTGAGAAGTYVITPAQTLSAGTAFTAATPDVKNGGAGYGNFQIWNSTTNTWQTYIPGVNSQGSSGTRWGPEAEFGRRWMADHTGQTLYLIKISVDGTSLCNRSSQNWDPQSGSLFSIQNAIVQQAETALTTAGASWNVKGFVWGQGEQDSPGFGESLRGCEVYYQNNLINFISQIAKPAAVSASFTGSISGTTLTVSSVTGTPLAKGQVVTGTGIAVHTWITGQLTGTAGGAGTYSLQVDQQTASETLTDTTTGATFTGGVSGTPMLITTQTAGALPAVNDVISGTGLLSGTVVSSIVTQAAWTGSVNTSGIMTVTALSAGVIPSAGQLVCSNCAAGSHITVIYTPWNGTTGSYQLSPTGTAYTSGSFSLLYYLLNLPQTVASETMTATGLGWGTGANTAVFSLFQVASAPTLSPVGVAQRYVNAADGNTNTWTLTAHTTQRYDKDGSPVSSIHDSQAFITEVGRRLYLGYTGACDYHSATC